MSPVGNEIRKDLMKRKIIDFLVEFDLIEDNATGRFFIEIEINQGGAKEVSASFRKTFR